MSRLLFAFCAIALFANVAHSLKFDPDFMLGVGSSAHQIEGAWNQDGKIESIQDYYHHLFPNLVKDGTNGDVACDSYNKLDQDIAMLRFLNVSHYKLSIAWTRIIKNVYTNEINPAGVNYYNRLINALLQNKIVPIVTLYHWDLPMTLQELGGWTNPEIVGYFKRYADVCFRLFGDRVKWWITIDEPEFFCHLGQQLAFLAPYYRNNIGNYLCMHYVLLSHAAAYRTYETVYKNEQKGKVGYTINADWFIPETRNDTLAAEIVFQFRVGWPAHAIYSKRGNYPPIVIQSLDRISRIQNMTKSKLPKFTRREINMIRGSADFLSVHHYTTYLVRRRVPDPKVLNYENDIPGQNIINEQFEPTALGNLKQFAPGVRMLLNKLKSEYDNPEIIIATAFADFQNVTVNDQPRVKHIKDHLKAVGDAKYIDGCKVSAFTSWNLMDDFEWDEGNTISFGMFDVDFKSPNKTRTAKESAKAYKTIIQKREI